MYRVMIVDDEFFIRKSFRNRINWASYQMEVVGEAANGEQAWELIPTLRPDLMFVDIRMPVLDGFDLATLLRDEYPDIIVIIISAYNDFQYARKAIENGVFDYLLKPLDEEELDKTLHRLLARLAKQEHPIETINLYEQPTLDLSGKELCCISLYEKCGSKHELQNQSLLFHALQHFGTLRRIIGHGMPLCQMFCLTAPSIDRTLLVQNLSELTMSVWSPESTVLGISSICRGNEETDRDQLLHILAEAISAAKQKILHPDAQIFCWTPQMEDYSSDCSPYDTPKLAMVRMALSKKDYPAFSKSLLSYLDDFDWAHICDTITLEMIVSTVMEFLFKAGWDSGMIQEVQIYTNDFRHPNFLLLFDHPEDIHKQLHALIPILTDEMSSKNSVDLAQRITQYIQENYAGNLQMEELERQFFMSSSSLLLAFKKKKVMTITAYIESVRMEKAKELLKSGLYSVQATAEAVGYLDANYFCRAFKRYTGSTPSKYRLSK